MQKLMKSIFLIFFILFFCATFVLAEEITITTYYPSPYGSYNSLQTDKLGVGDNNDDGAWTSADVPTTSGDAWIKGKVGIGTSTLVPLVAKLTVVTNNNEDSLWYSYNNTNSSDFDFIVNRARGTSEAPLAVSSVNNLGSIRFHGYDGASFIQGAAMEARVDGTPGINDMPTKLTFATTPDGARDPISRMVIKNDGKIGIGTTEPNAGLHLLGISNVDNSLDNIIMQGISNIFSNNPALIARRARGDSLATIASVNYAANDTLLELIAAGYDGNSFVEAANIRMSVDGLVSDGIVPARIQFRTLDTTGVLTDRMVITNTGNVGIGTEDPKDTLHVNPGRVIIGDIGNLPPSTFDTGTGPNTLILSGENRDVTLVSMRNGDSNKADLEFFRSQGSPGIPTNVGPNTELGWIQWRGYYGGTFGERIASIGAIMDGAVSGGNDRPTRLEFKTTPDDGSGVILRMVIKNNGNVGIGVDNPTYQLQLSTDSANKPATNLWSTVSDKRIKKNISDFTDGLNVVMKLKPHTYQYNGLGGKGYDDTNSHIGFIAQEVEPIAPYMIETGKGTIDGAPVKDFKSYQGHALSFILVNAIQEQQEIIKAQQLQIDGQRVHIDELKARLDKLEEK